MPGQRVFQMEGVGPGVTVHVPLLNYKYNSHCLVCGLGEGMKDNISG